MNKDYTIYLVEDTENIEESLLDHEYSTEFENNDNAVSEVDENDVLTSTAKWSDADTNLLIFTYNENQHKFDSPQYSHAQVWTLISTELSKYGCVYRNGKKCSEKWRNLKKTYEKFRTHNTQTGNDRRTWKFYDALDEIFFKNPSVNPIFTLSSTGLAKKRCTGTTSPSPVPSTSSLTTIELQTVNKSSRDLENAPTMKRKRVDVKKNVVELLEEGKERRHRERMEQKQKMFDVFMEKFSKKNKESDDR